MEPKIESDASVEVVQVNGLLPSVILGMGGEASIRDTHNAAAVAAAAIGVLASPSDPTTYATMGGGRWRGSAAAGGWMDGYAGGTMAVRVGLSVCLPVCLSQVSLGVPEDAATWRPVTIVLYCTVLYSTVQYSYR